MPDKNPTILKVAIVVPLNQLFDYSVPAGMETPQIACRVMVRFSGCKKIAWVVKIGDSTKVPQNKLLAISSVIDKQPLWPPELWQLLKWCWTYYHHPPGEVLSTALPPLLRTSEAVNPPVTEAWKLTELGAVQIPEELHKRAPKQAALIAALAQPANAEHLNEHFQGSSWRPVLRNLLKKGWLDACSSAAAENLTPVPGPSLTTEQTTAISQIEKTLAGFTCSLLYGVTGSGKTEVYLQLAAKVLAAGKQVLFLVPEIGLVPQLSRRVQQRLGLKAALVHSAQSAGERYRAWYQASIGEAKVVIGTRSALFTPTPNLGLIIVDEEHDSAYKQQDHWRYSARDVAVKRASLENCPLILGSATPSLESLQNADTGRYQFPQLLARANNQPIPGWHVLEMRQQSVSEGLLPETLDLISKALANDQQVLVFLNRRGFAPVLMCHWCGWQADCERCDAPMTWHQRANHLDCHRCGVRHRVPVRCPACDSLDLRPLGEGTERIAEYLQQQFPQTPVIRFDRDTTRRKNSAADILESVREGKSSILVGTQMLAKGHHLPRVSLAVILNIDQSLFSTDFRAMEKLSQLLTQVAGRSGRGEQEGMVVLQTYHPQQAQLVQLLEQGYLPLARSMLVERQQAGLPPYSYQAMLRAECLDNSVLNRALNELARQASLLLKESASQVEVYGPMPAIQARRAGRHRQVLLLQSSSRKELDSLLRILLPKLSGLPASHKVSWALDISPQEQ